VFNQSKIATEPFLHFPLSSALSICGVNKLAALATSTRLQRVNDAIRSARRKPLATACGNCRFGFIASPAETNQARR